MIDIEVVQSALEKARDNCWARAAHAGQMYLSQKIAMTRETIMARPHLNPLQSLSAREREILHLVAAGHTSARIAAQLILSPKTVETYRRG